MTAQQSQPGEMFFSPTSTHIFPECPGLSNPMSTAETTALKNINGESKTQLPFLPAADE